MAIAKLLEFAGVTSDQYDRVLERLELGGKLSSGGVYHIAGPTDDGWHWIASIALRSYWDSPC